MVNEWIEHVKNFARKNNLSYGCAITEPRCQASYKPKKLTLKEIEEQRRKASQQARNDSAPKKLTFKEIEEQQRKSSQYARRISAEVRREARGIINSPTILEKKEIKDNSNKAEDNSQPLIVRYKKKSGVLSN